MIFKSAGWVAALLLALAGQAKADWGQEIIYFVMVDRFADGDGLAAPGIEPENPVAFHGGDLRGLTEQLDEISDLGATAVWITPIAQQVSKPIPSEAGLFHGHHGYWAEDLSGVDPRFGSEEDLRALADALHQREMKLMLDVVYNHVGYGSSFETDPERTDWLRMGDDCGGDPVTSCIYGLPDLRTENEDVATYVLEQQLGLAERVGADGFRLDTFKHVDKAFWMRHRTEIRERLGDDFYLLGEVWGADKYDAAPVFDDDLADGLIDFGFRSAIYDFLRGVWTAEKLGRYLTNRHTVKAGHHLAPFLSNHDMPMLLAQLRGDTDKLKIGFALLMTASGPPIIAWGEEVGRRGGVWPDNRGDMPWGAQDVQPGAGLARDDALRGFVRELIAWRKAHSDLTTADQETLLASRDGLVFRKGRCTVVGINRGEEGWDIAALGLGRPDLSSSVKPRMDGVLAAKSASLWNAC